jgi:AcrR family transcriptional regulator
VTIQVVAGTLHAAVLMPGLASARAVAVVTTDRLVGVIAGSGGGTPRGREAGAAARAGDGRHRGRGRPGYDIESVLSVAVSVFIERGYDGTSMELLSQRLGITKSSIYHHVDGKEDLLRMALDRALDGLFEAVADAQDAGEPAIRRLERLVYGSVQVLADRLPYVTLLLRVRGNTDVERKALDRRREFDRIVAGLVKEAEAEGDIRADVDPIITARLLFGMVNSIVEWYKPHGEDSGRRLASAVCAVAFDGLRVRPA